MGVQSYQTRVRSTEIRSSRSGKLWSCLGVWANHQSLKLGGGTRDVNRKRFIFGKSTAKKSAFVSINFNFRCSMFESSTIWEAKTDES
jgi:hypothetical protein